MTASSGVPAGAAIRHFQGTSTGDEIVCEIQKSSREVYWIMRRTFKGYKLVDVRVWFDDADTGERRPGKGVSIKAEALPEIVKALARLIDGGEGRYEPSRQPAAASLQSEACRAWNILFALSCT
ncbi:MAG: hypothetical protein CRU78_11330 [Candidatus Accumulibacter phosphatis]|uniref:Transcriptional coactivator p15 (PC4) C-terminal domain-containing protein n=1 Tax=Candidatus Accumulibacter phosphatis TaxID=327160 RepID=A0A6A7RVW1_9PROT|nr:hypothetical protein [Candidatus Accumulibacter phosphatis]